MEGEISCPGYAIRMREGVDQDCTRLCFDALRQGLLEALCRRLGYCVRRYFMTPRSTFASCILASGIWSKSNSLDFLF
ncbi:unnamed protein product [Ixodes pacificus]